MENNSISTKLRDLRKALGYSQDYVAAKLSTNITRISLIENDKTVPDVNEIVIFAEIYNVDINEILLNKNTAENQYCLSETQQIIDGFEQLDSLLKENQSVMLRKWFFSIHNELNEIMEEVKFLNTAVK